MSFDNAYRSKPLPPCSYNGVTATHLLFAANDFWHDQAADLINEQTGVSYDASEQMRIRGEAAAAWQICLVVSQCFHLAMCTTRKVSLFQHRVTSWALVLAVAAELTLLCILVYTPPMQALLGISPPPPFVWAFGVGVGLILLVFTEYRKYVLRQPKRTFCTSILDW